MLNNPVKWAPTPLSTPLSLRYAAVQRILGAVDMGLLADAEGRTMPAKVYAASEDGQEWIVEAPVSDEPAGGAGGECKTFTGAAGLLRALEYAHERYGSARYLAC
jgi:hypothetical protein